ncbi:MAG: CPBP family intramembrane metalloprotease [Turicibacter sp.]|nr:CPBP family intramembrane metalloprotease [Turicibacter sp.]
MKRMPKTLLMILSYIFSMFVMPAVAITTLVNVFQVRDKYLLMVFGNFISYLFLAICTLSIVGDDVIADFKKLPPWGKVAKGVVGGWALLFLFNIVASHLLSMLTQSNDSSQNQQAINSIMNVHPLMMAATTVLLAPLVEELIFRKTLMGSMKKLPAVLSILISSMLFGLIHVVSGGDYIFIIPYMAMGIPLGWSYYKNQNIWFPIGIHMMQNLFSTLVLLLSGLL